MYAEHDVIQVGGSASHPSNVVIAWQLPFPISLSCLQGSTFGPLLGKGADDFGGDVEEEYGRDEGE